MAKKTETQDRPENGLKELASSASDVLIQQEDDNSLASKGLRPLPPPLGRPDAPVDFPTHLFIPENAPKVDGIVVHTGQHPLQR